MCLSCKNAG
jgi:hypothetical protein